MRMMVIMIAALLGAGCAEQVTPAALTIPQSFPDGMDPEPMEFGVAVDIDRLLQGVEPSLAFDQDGAIWVTGPSLPLNLIAAAMGGDSQSLIWKSDDGGDTFQLVGEGPLGRNGEHDGGGDSDVAIDAAGRVYIAELASDAIPVLTSMDGGTTWNVTANVSQDASVDRPWIVTGDPGQAWVIYAAREQYFRDSIFAVSTCDGGATWSAPVRVAPLEGFPMGRPVWDPALRALYVPHNSRAGISVSVSVDDGATFDTHVVAPEVEPFDVFLLPSIDIDRAGYVYLAWSERSEFGTELRYSWSPPGGEAWSESIAPLGGTTVMPVVVAGDEGKISLIYLAATPIPSGLSPPEQAHGARWDLNVLHTLEARAASPKFLRSFPYDSVHRGSICGYGSACLVGAAVGRPDMVADRSLGDFIDATLTPEGDLAIVFTRDDPVGAAHVTPTYIVQTGGERIRNMTP